MAAPDQILDRTPRLRLGGGLAEVAGPAPALRFATIAQAGALLRVNHPALAAFADADVTVRLNGHGVGAGAYHLPLGAEAVVEIHPAAAGAMEGAGKAVFGALLVAASLVVPAAGVAGALGLSQAVSSTLLAATGSLGLSIAANGVAQHLASLNPTPDTPEQRGGGTYSGPLMTVGEGATLPLLYGYARVGGVPIQRSIDTVAV